jgi:Cytochrome P460
MRTRFGLCALALVIAAGAWLLFLDLSPNGDAGQSLKRSGATGLTESTLASIKLRLEEIGAPQSTRDDKLVRVTREPFAIPVRAARLCASIGQSPDPHEGKSIHVLVTSGGCDTMKTGKGVYPRGTVILKEKFADADGTKPVLFTGMLKRGEGYNAASGDWQYFVLDSDATSVTTGSMHSCIHCHVSFRGTDFVSRRYLTKDVVKGR